MVFSWHSDSPDVPKAITIESMCRESLFIEAVSSKNSLVSAIRSCGSVRPGEYADIQVYPKLQAFRYRTTEPVFISILIGNAKVDIPVKFID